MHVRACACMVPVRAGAMLTMPRCANSMSRGRRSSGGLSDDSMASAQGSPQRARLGLSRGASSTSPPPLYGAGGESGGVPPARQSVEGERRRRGSSSSESSQEQQARSSPAARGREHHPFRAELVGLCARACVVACARVASGTRAGPRARCTRGCCSAWGPSSGAAGRGGDAVTPPRRRHPHAAASGTGAREARGRASQRWAWRSSGRAELLSKCRRRSDVDARSGSSTHPSCGGGGAYCICAAGRPTAGPDSNTQRRRATRTTASASKRKLFQEVNP